MITKELTKEQDALRGKLITLRGGTAGQWRVLEVYEGGVLITRERVANDISLHAVAFISWNAIEQHKAIPGALYRDKQGTSLYTGMQNGKLFAFEHPGVGRYLDFLPWQYEAVE